MKSVTVQLTTSNVAGQVVTLPVGYEFALLTAVELLNTGNYPDASAVAPVQETIVTGTLGTTGVKLTASNQITFGSGVTLDTTYGSVAVTGFAPGEIPTPY